MMSHPARSAWLLLSVAIAQAAIPSLAGAATPVSPPARPDASAVSPLSAPLVDTGPIRPGDDLQVTLPGEETFTKPFRVNRDGRISLPEVGAVTVGGLSVSDATDRIRLALGQAFKELWRLQVGLKERRLIVTINGYVVNPGTVELPEGTAIPQALAAAGNLKSGAQLDGMRVRRAGKWIPFDYKKYQTTGDDSLLPILQPLDEIFVPASPQLPSIQSEYDPKTMQAGDAADERSAIKVFGEVEHVGSYNWRSGLTVRDVIIKSGGPTRYAGTEQILILSAGQPHHFNLKDYLTTGKEELNPELGKGDTVFVPVQTEAVRTGTRVVYAIGEVNKPGSFDAQGGQITFTDLLANAGGPSRFADTTQLRIIHAGGKVERFDLVPFLQGNGPPPPKIVGGDAIYIPEKKDSPGGTEASWINLPPERTVKAVGEVKSPQRMAWSADNTILDLIAQVNGFTLRGDPSHISIVHHNGKHEEFDLKNFLEKGGDPTALPVIEAGAIVSVPQIPQSPSDLRLNWVELPQDSAIFIMGAVGNPGRFAFKRGLGLLDIVGAANGPAKDADLLNIRVDHRGEGVDRVSKVNLARYYETGDETLLPRIRPGDVIFFPSTDRNWLEMSASDTIRVLGSVNKPGRYGFDDSMTILDLLAAAGGPSEHALDRRILVVNKTPGTNQARSFNLQKFARTGDYSMLPTLRAGDTVYVPNQDASDWERFFSTFRDLLSAAAIATLIKG